MAEATKARAVGFNHVALEVGDIKEALAFYGRLFDFKLRGKSGTSAFIDLGDQFLALQKGRTQPADEGRHFGLVVDDKDAVRKALADAGIQPLPGPFLDFLDPWGNRIEIYRLVTRRPVPIPVPTFLSDPTATPAVCHAVGALF
jgi:catechol 2,3-dioxygenase-like lactoylglutathione lyase family enzyme